MIGPGRSMGKWQGDQAGGGASGGAGDSGTIGAGVGCTGMVCGGGRQLGQEGVGERVGGAHSRVVECLCFMVEGGLI